MIFEIKTKGFGSFLNKCIVMRILEKKNDSCIILLTEIKFIKQ